MGGSTRAPAVSGLFYNDSPISLRRQVLEFLAAASSAEDRSATKNSELKAVVVPHAGYIYSGPVAAFAYKEIQKEAAHFKKIVLIGPSHHVPFQGVAVPKMNTFATPLGSVSVDLSLKQIALNFSFVIENDEPHRKEHSLEVQLPFLQVALKKFSILPIVIGQASATDLTQLLYKLCTEKDVLIVISSDLSHYLPYNIAQKRDLNTIDHILHFEPEKIEYDDACGRQGIQAFLHYAQSKKLIPILFNYKNSGDTAGDKSQVVGYCSIGFYE